jgi:hypothetical protein
MGFPSLPDFEIAGQDFPIYPGVIAKPGNKQFLRSFEFAVGRSGINEVECG